MVWLIKDGNVKVFCGENIGEVRVRNRLYTKKTEPILACFAVKHKKICIKFLYLYRWQSETDRIPAAPNSAA